MSCDEIKVIDETNEITLINHEDKINVVTEETTTVIVDNREVVEAREEETEKIIINASDVIFSGSTALDIDMNCTATEQVGDAVYVFGDGEVRQANNSDISIAKVLGFVVNKSSDTTCKVRVAGVVDDFTGLSSGSQYFLSGVSGDIDTIAPTTTGSVLVRVGQAIDSDRFMVNINNNYIIRS